MADDHHDHPPEPRRVDDAAGRLLDGALDVGRDLVAASPRAGRPSAMPAVIGVSTKPGLHARPCARCRARRVRNALEEARRGRPWPRRRCSCWPAAVARDRADATMVSAPAALALQQSRRSEAPQRRAGEIDVDHRARLGEVLLGRRLVAEHAEERGGPRRPVRRDARGHARRARRRRSVAAPRRSAGHDLCLGARRAPPDRSRDRLQPLLTLRPARTISRAPSRGVEPRRRLGRSPTARRAR